MEHDMEGKTELAFDRVSFGYEPGETILQDITFRIGSGESVCLAGANGAGKTAVLRLAAGLNPCTTGTVSVEDIPVTKKTLPEIRKRMGYVFQEADHQLFLSTVREDVAFAPRNYGLPEAEVNARTEAALTRAGIADLADRPPYKLSGGQKKMASIATILSMDPALIILDEPTAALDPRNRRRVIDLLNGLHGTKLITTHDLDMALDTCERLILLGGGRIVYDGPAAAGLQDRKLLEENGLELPLRFQGRGGTTKWN